MGNLPNRCICDGFGHGNLFSITQEADGGYVAECRSEDIFTEGTTWEELRENAKEAVEAWYLDRPKPTAVRLHLVRNEFLSFPIS